MFLLDANLPPRAPEILSGQFGEISHVNQCGLRSATDQEIWAYVTMA